MRALPSLLVSFAIAAAGCLPTVGEPPAEQPDAGAAAPQCKTSADCSEASPVCSNSVCVAACASASHMPDIASVPSDIIFVVDQSGSMSEETAYVQQKINDFSSLISASKIDYRVVMIASPSTSYNAICVPPPLGGPSCGNNTRFRLVNQYVDSNDGPEQALVRYSSYSDFLRPNAVKHFVFITDDNSTMSAANFLASLRALTPTGTFQRLKVHGIYAFGTPGGYGCTGSFGSGASEGTVYSELIAQTGGAAGVICSGDWTQVFHDITSSVVSGSLSCSIKLPTSSTGQALDPSSLTVRYHSGSSASVIPQVSGAGQCAAGGGWYYDNSGAPTAIELCDSTCTTIGNDTTATVSVAAGCQAPIL